MGGMYNNYILHQLTRIADSLEKIEKKLPEPPILTANETREKVGLEQAPEPNYYVPKRSCFECKNIACPNDLEPCLSCINYSNWIHKGDLDHEQNN